MIMILEIWAQIFYYVCIKRLKRAEKISYLFIFYQFTYVDVVGARGEAKTRDQHPRNLGPVAGLVVELLHHLVPVRHVEGAVIGHHGRDHGRLEAGHITQGVGLGVKPP